MKEQMTVTHRQSSDRSFVATDTHVALALQAISQRKGLLAFSALPDAPVMPAPEPGRLRRMLRSSAPRFGQPVQRPSLMASRLAVPRSSR